MTVRIVRLGSSRQKNEGLRIGTVRRPPRGVAKARFAKDNWYDVWMPDLSPQPATVSRALKAQSTGDEREWKVFVTKFRQEMNEAGPSRVLDLLAALSATADFSVGCYCEDESHCHRTILRALLAERGARME